MIETFKDKFAQGFYDPETVALKLNESAGTSEHPFKLHKKTVLTNLYACVCVCVCLLVAAVTVRKNWNNLPSSIVLAGTLNFLNLDKHFEQKIFSTR